MSGDYLISIILRARDLASKGIKSASNALKDFSHNQKQVQKDSQTTESALKKLASQFDKTSYKLGELNRSLQGLQVALVIKYFQALLSAAIALGGELVSLASSAIQAGAALGGALVAGAAQAIPVFALLAGAISRVKEVMKAVEIQQKITTSAAADNKQKMDDQRASADRLAAAKRSLSNAIRDQRDAQTNLNRARREGIRTLIDMAFAQKRAILDAKNANLALIDAKSALRRAELTGSAQEIKQARLDVQAAVLDKDESRVQASRSTIDNSRAQRGGVNNLQTTISARKQLADANSRVADATRDVARAQAQATETASSLTSQQQNLANLLSQLSPAERRLYDSIIRIKGVYKDFRKETIDSITGAFATAVDRAAGALLDPRIRTAAKGLSDEIGKQLNRLSKFALGSEGRSAFLFFSGEAKKNLESGTSILVTFFRILRNIAQGAAGMFSRLLRDTDKWLKKIEATTFSLDSLKKFFDGDGENSLKAWLSLLGSIFNLLGAIIGAAAGRGTRSVKELAETFNRWADYIRDHKKDVQEFFERAHKGTLEVLRVLTALVVTMFSLFDEGQIKALADFLIMVLIPALANVIVIMGELTQIFHEFLSLPIINELAQWLVTIFLLIKAFTLIKTAFVTFASTIVSFAVANPLVFAIIAIVAAILVLDKKLHFLAPTFKFIRKIAGEAFDWIKNAAEDVADYFSDVWNKGLLYWIRWPFKKAIEWLEKNGVFKWIEGATSDMVDFLVENVPKAADALIAPFKPLIGVWEEVWKGFRKIVKGTLAFIRGDLDEAGKQFGDVFGSIARAIGSVWHAVFAGIYSVTAKTLNAIVGAVNKVIGAFNKLPGPDIGKISYHVVENYDAAVTLREANAGRATTNYAGPHAEGGYLPSRPGGHLAIVGEDKYDEVILTSDPKHANRQRMLIDRFRGVAPHLFAKGGYVQGAVPPGASGTRRFADFLISKGYSVTSGHNGRHAQGGYHFRNGGDAVDFGDSVNNLARLWSFLSPYRRNIAELLGPYGGYHNGTKFFDGVFPNHADHIHIGGYGEKFGGGGILGALKGAFNAITNVPKILTDSIRSILGKREKGGSFIQSGLDSVYTLARDSIREIQSRAQDVANPAGSPTGSGAAGTAQVRKWAAQALRYTGYYNKANLNALVGRIMQESGGDPNIVQRVIDVNSRNGDPAIGLAQVIGSTFASYRDKKLPNDRRDPLANLVAAIRYMIARYGHIVGATGTGYATGTSSAKRGLHLVGEKGPELMEFQGGERVYNAKQTESFLKPSSGLESAMYKVAQSIGAADAWADQVNAIKTPLKLTQVAQKGARIARMVQKIADTVQSVIDNASSALLRAQVKIGKDGRVSVHELDDVQQAQVNAQSTTQVGSQLLDQRSSLLSSLSAQRNLVKNSKGRAKDRAQADLKKLQESIDGLDDQIRQNALDQVSAQRAIVDAQIAHVDKAAETRSNSASRTDRLLTALGNSSPTRLIQSQAQIATDQLEGLKAQLAEAQKMGYTERVNDLWARIEELNVSIAEYGSQLFQAQIDAVNDAASKSLSRNDRRSRLANLIGTRLGKANAQAGVLDERAGILATQRQGLMGLLAAATSEDQIKSLREQIEELDVTIAENTKAQEDNTLEIRNAQIDAITSRGGFLTGVIGGLKGIVNTLGAITGVTDNNALIGLASRDKTTLTETGNGLADKLLEFFGIDLRGLHGMDFVNAIGGINFDDLRATMTDDQWAMFNGLINALIGNEAALTQNTQELQDLNRANTAQSFASSFWQKFRVPIFNGANGLLPNFIPSMADGGMTLREGLYHLHPGEIVGPIEKVLNGAGGGDTYHLTVTTPTEVLDPSDVGRQLAFYRKTGGR